MAEGAALRVQTAVDNMVKELDNSHLRKILGNVHRCAVKCCDNSSLSMDGARTCIMNCSEPLNKAQSKVEGELGNFQHCQRNELPLYQRKMTAASEALSRQLRRPSVALVSSGTSDSVCVHVPVTAA
ncbi:protein FAM136A-like isoform X2 [Dermacentor variabilis]|uniref:protein FAM136A-like isoform X2 n=1 Tax=Dermacentor variabilis TaxID=34621 RepID=UPI003F5B204C